MFNAATLTHRSRLLNAGFICMIALGMGFAARAAVLKTWGSQYGFTNSELGVITGFGLTGFGLTVMFFSVLVERLGYGPTVAMTFGFHLLSGVISLFATPVFHWTTASFMPRRTRPRAGRLLLRSSPDSANRRQSHLGGRGSCRADACPQTAARQEPRPPV